MPFTVRRAGIRLLSARALMGLVCLLMAPAVVIAQETTPIVSPGAPAVITGGGEQDVLLRADPGFDAVAVTPLANGTPAQVLDGPVAAADGSSWYLIDVGGQVGYAPAGHLGGSAPVPVEPAPVAGDQAPAAPPVPDLVPANGAVALAAGAAVTTTDVNLRSAPDGASTVLAT
ncbi:MAG: SH3 domain-containing protein, partial [Chloroflexota bacterium]|nr:SH3 domain-containing protein [Chloroflexota bacterium]